MTELLVDRQLPNGDDLVSQPTGLAASRSGMQPSVAILGTRGVPARHGGFETFAERLALYLVGRGWDVTVYCQEDGQGETQVDTWNGVRRVRIPEPRQGALGTMVFDWKSTRHAARRPGIILTLGYNTALFTGWYRLRRRANLINMDGLEWQRAKWSAPAKAWLYLNERFGCWFGNHLFADHPEIAQHLQTRVPHSKISTIPYGADAVLEADPGLLARFGVHPRGYGLVVARPEPENSILEIVRAFSSRPRGKQLVVLGRYEPEKNPYHARVLAAAGPEVLFPGAVYDKSQVNSLRFFSRLYIHGHTVGGTNPALVEALGAGCAVLAHDNRFNRWVAGDGAHYFGDELQCEEQLTHLLADESELARMRAASRERHEYAFTWDQVLEQYEHVLLRFSSDRAEQQPDRMPAIRSAAEPATLIASR